MGGCLHKKEKNKLPIQYQVFDEERGYKMPARKVKRWFKGKYRDVFIQERHYDDLDFYEGCWEKFKRKHTYYETATKRKNT